MIYYVAANASRNGCGTKEKPFQTISEAAGIACAGDEVLVICKSQKRRYRQKQPHYIPLRRTAGRCHNRCGACKKLDTVSG